MDPELDPDPELEEPPVEVEGGAEEEDEELEPEDEELLEEGGAEELEEELGGEEVVGGEGGGARRRWVVARGSARGVVLNSVALQPEAIARRLKRATNRMRILL